jgi:hypothetical protein
MLTCRITYFDRSNSKARAANQPLSLSLLQIRSNQNKSKLLSLPPSSEVAQKRYNNNKNQSLPSILTRKSNQREIVLRMTT